MSRQAVSSLWMISSAAVCGASLLACIWDARVALGIAAGGLWNMASLWCLMQLLDAWLGARPSRRRAILWLLVKFPLLYLVIVMALRWPSISLVGFGIGFTLVLALAAVGYAQMARLAPLGRSSPVT